MDEPIVEQIAVCIATAIDGQQDPHASLTLRAVRPELLEWDENKCKHGDCIIELVKIAKQTGSNDFRSELGTWVVVGFVKTSPDGVPADRAVSRMAETIKRSLLSAQGAKAFGGLAKTVDIAETNFVAISGGVEVGVTVTVAYSVSLYDGYR